MRIRRRTLLTPTTMGRPHTISMLLLLHLNYLLVVLRSITLVESFVVPSGTYTCSGSGFQESIVACKFSSRRTGRKIQSSSMNRHNSVHTNDMTKNENDVNFKKNSFWNLSSSGRKWNLRFNFMNDTVLDDNTNSNNETATFEADNLDSRYKNANITKMDKNQTIALVDGNNTTNQDLLNNKNITMQNGEDDTIDDARLHPDGVLETFNISSWSDRSKTLSKNVNDMTSSFGKLPTSKNVSINKSTSAKVKSSKKTRFNSTQAVSQPLLTTLPQDAVLTVKDLEAILNGNGFVRRIEMLESIERGQDESAKKKKGPTLSGGQLAFPQPSELTNRSIIVGTTISASVMCTILGITVYPGLWLVGLVVGANIGNRVAVLSTISPEIRMNLFSSYILQFGKKVAKIYLTCYDFCQGIWYLYKTGQLSYDYMKQYQALDERFKIQEKVDAWNARFQQGKVDFDRWEKENEVGRKILAGLRTVWLIEEKSLKKVSTKKKPKQQYRIVEYGKKTSAWLSRLAYAFWNAITGGGFDELRDIINGVKMSVIEINWETSARMAGSGLLAFFTINLVVALFEVSPRLLSTSAFVVGVLWPEWFRETYRNVRELLSGTAAKSRAEKEAARIATLQPPKVKSNSDSVTGMNTFVEDICNQIFPKKEKQEEKKGLLSKVFRRKSKEVKRNWFGGYANDLPPKTRRRAGRRRDQYQVWGGAYKS